MPQSDENKIDKSREVQNSKRRVSFADTTSIKEFLVTRDANIEWNCTYEEPVFYESSSSVDTTNTNINPLKKQKGSQQNQEKSSEVSNNSVNKIQDQYDSFSNFLTGFLETNPESSKSESDIIEQNCEATMDFTCQALSIINKSDTIDAKYFKDNIKHHKIPLSPDLKNDRTLFQKTLDITCFNNQTSSSLEDKDSFKFCAINDSSEKDDLEEKHILPNISVGTEICSNNILNSVNGNSNPLKAAENNSNVISEKDDMDMDLTSNSNLHCLQKLPVNDNNCIHSKIQNFENSVCTNFPQPAADNFFCDKNDLKKPIVPSMIGDVSFCATGLQNMLNETFDKVNSSADMEGNIKDMSLTVCNMFEKKNFSSIEKESPKSYEIKNDKIDTLPWERKKRPDHSKLDEDSENLSADITYSEDLSVLNMPAQEMCDFRERVAESFCKITENEGKKIKKTFDVSTTQSMTSCQNIHKNSPKLNKNIENLNFPSKVCLIDESQCLEENYPSSLKVNLFCKENQEEFNVSSENKNPNISEQNENEKNLSSNLSPYNRLFRNGEGTENFLSIVSLNDERNLSSVYLKDSETSSNDICLESIPNSPIDEKLEEEEKPHISLLDQEINITDDNDKTFRDDIQSDIETNKSLNENKKGDILRGSKSDFQPETSNFSKENMQISNNSLSSQTLSFSRSSANGNSFGVLDGLRMHLISNETIECIQPPISPSLDENTQDRRREEDISLSLKLPYKVHCLKEKESLEQEELDFENRNIEIQGKKNQNFSLTENELTISRKYCKAVEDKNSHTFQNFRERESSMQSIEENDKMLGCRLCNDYINSRSLGMFDIQTFGDVICLNIESFKLKMNILVNLQYHRIICGLNLELQLQKLMKNVPDFAFKAVEDSVQQLQTKIINVKLCEVESLLKKFIKSYQIILKLLRDMYVVKAYYPSLAENDHLHVVVMNAMKHILVNLKIQITFDTVPDFCTPYFSVKINVKRGNIRTHMFDETIKIAASEKSLLDIIKIFADMIGNK